MASDTKGLTQTTDAKKTATTTTSAPSIAENTERAVIPLDQLAKEYALVRLQTMLPAERALKQVAGLRALRQALNPIMKDLMELRGTENGFFTDRDKTDKYPPYTVDEVREVIITALQRGLMLTGNEFNIISGRCYTTKEGYRALVRDFDGLTDLKETYQIPKVMGGGAIVACEARWRLYSQSHSLRAEIAVRLNAGQGADAAIGKATRKLLARVYAQLTGSEFTADDVRDDVPLDALAAPTSMLDKVGGLIGAAKEVLSKDKAEKVPAGLAPGEIPPETEADF